VFAVAVELTIAWCRYVNELIIGAWHEYRLVDWLSVII
jgi:hypothetical protein